MKIRSLLIILYYPTFSVGGLAEINSEYKNEYI